jgi:RNA polymerase-interacting CarD/CdnL/TRCF family regulator
VRGPPPRHPNEQREQLPAVEGTIADADELKVGDRVVYPNQGVYRVIGNVEMEIGGQKLPFVRMQREQDDPTVSIVSVPRAKVPSIGLRRVATGEQMEGVFHYLAAQFDDPELDWKVRHRDNADRLIAGGVLGVAEVVKGLHSLSRIRPLPTKEREQYDNARHLLVHEIATSLGVPPVLAEDYVDFALMPPAGVTFKLKPPPKPVLLPSRPKKRPRPAEEEDDLGLGDLGLDLDLEGALEGGATEGAAAGEGEGAEGEGAAAEEGGAETAPQAGAEPEAAAGDLGEGEAMGDEGEAEEAPAAPPARKGAKPAAAKPAKAREAKAAKKAAAPKKAPAAKKAAATKKPAKAAPPPKRGGKKK